MVAPVPRGPRRPHPGSVARTAETAEVAEALAGLLHRVELARGESERALVSARDFAASAEHELRTPLTAMRTDLDVLTAHPDLPAAERADVIAQFVARQQRVEDTLAALSRLATGDLAEPDRSPVELTDLVAQAVATAARAVPAGTAVGAVLPDSEITVTGSAAGLRLAVDNLLANAVRHAGARRIEAAVRLFGDRVLVTVDDDGAGVPPDERARLRPVPPRQVRAGPRLRAGVGAGRPAGRAARRQRVAHRQPARGHPSCAGTAAAVRCPARDQRRCRWWLRWSAT